MHGKISTPVKILIVSLVFPYIMVFSPGALILYYAVPMLLGPELLLVIIYLITAHKHKNEMQELPDL